MACTVRIPDEFRGVPAQIRQRLRRRLAEICAALNDVNQGPLLESLVQSCLAITVGLWKFHYEFHADQNQIVVVEATRLE
jgi:hypothetical protein